jgi:hypothetical protein
MEATVPDFTNKVIVLYLSTTSDLTADGLVLEAVTFQQYGDRLFIVGRSADIGTGSWSAGVRAEVAWDYVSCYLVFDNLDDYVHRASSYQPTFKERIKRVFE